MGKLTTVMIRVHFLATLLIGCLSFLQCGGNLSQGAGTQEIGAAERLLTGILVNADSGEDDSEFLAQNEAPAFLRVKTLFAQTEDFNCSADQVIAVSSDGEKREADLDAECRFEINVKTNKSYVLNFFLEDDFVASLSFVSLPSALLSVSEGAEPLDLGGIAIAGDSAFLQDEAETICQWDADGDGKKMCEDDVEKAGDGQNGNQEEPATDESASDECGFGDKVTICHLPPGNEGNAQEVCVSVSSVTYVAHLKHGDTVGACVASGGDGGGEEGDVVVPEETEEDGDSDDEETSDEEADEVCQAVAQASFEFDRIQNWGQGDLTEIVYLGDVDSAAEDERFDIADGAGTPIVDDVGSDFHPDVPGISLQRGEGWIHFSLHGSHAKLVGKEALEGKLKLHGAKIVRIVNDPLYKFERPTDGAYSFGKAGEDEYKVMADDATLYLVTTVTTQNDGFTLYYEIDGDGLCAESDAGEGDDDAGEEEAENGPVEEDGEEAIAAPSQDCYEENLARLDFLKIQNWYGGDLQERVFVGDGDSSYGDAEWFVLTDATGAYIVDDDFARDVPGIALRRGEGWIEFFFHGKGGKNVKEAMIGDIQFQGAEVTALVNDPSNPMERPKNGKKGFGQADEDEYALIQATTVNIVSAVTSGSDAFRIYYTPQLKSVVCQ